MNPREELVAARDKLATSDVARLSTLDAVAGLHWDTINGYLSRILYDRNPRTKSEFLEAFDLAIAKAGEVWK